MVDQDPDVNFLRLLLRADRAYMPTWGITNLRPSEPFSVIFMCSELDPLEPCGIFRLLKV